MLEFSSNLITVNKATNNLDYFSNDVQFQDKNSEKTIGDENTKDGLC